MNAKEAYLISILKNIIEGINSTANSGKFSMTAEIHHEETIETLRSLGYVVAQPEHVFLPSCIHYEVSWFYST